MDRHEYEINQLINPKKDIVKSNSKHRDKIETLIQGRRIGGIVGGGSEPPGPTPKIYVVIAAIPGVIGDNVFVGYGNGRTFWTVSTNDGVIRADTLQTPETIRENEQFMQKLNTNFPNVDVIEVGNEYSIGDTIDNYEDYIVI